MSANDRLGCCPTCRSLDMRSYLTARDSDGLFLHPFTLWECRNCGLVFLKDAVESQGLYSKAYYRNPKLGLSYLFDTALSWFIAKRIALIKKYKKTAGRILDIGCGDGAFLAGMKRNGWEVLAIDSSAGAGEYLTEKSITLLGRDFLSANIEEKSLDAVTYWYSFEHLSNPIVYLEKTHRLLKEGGIMVIAVQNIKSLQAMASARHWFQMDLPRHILHFSPRTLAVLLGASGFDIIKIEHRSVQMNVFGWYQSLLNVLGFPKNMAYRLVKREAVPSMRLLLFLLIAMAVFPFMFALSVGLAELEELSHRGGVITIIAKKCL